MSNITTNITSINTQPSTSVEATTRSTENKTSSTAVLVKVQPTPAARRDQADLSPASVLLSQALSLPDVRADKVAKIQQALADRTYHVSSATLADKLITTLQR